MGSVEDPMDYSGTSFNEWLVGIYSTKVKANKALKKTEEEYSNYVTYYVEKQEIL